MIAPLAPCAIAPAEVHVTLAVPAETAWLSDRNPSSLPVSAQPPIPE